jgi:hypothetical protein
MRTAQAAADSAWIGDKVGSDMAVFILGEVE